MEISGNGGPIKDLPRVFTKEQVADFLQVSTRTIDRAIRIGQLYAVKIGRSWRIPETSLAKYLAEKG